MRAAKHVPLRDARGLLRQLVALGQPQHLAVAALGHTGGDHDGAGRHRASGATLELGGVEEDVGEGDVRERALPEGVELGADAGSLLTTPGDVIEVVWGRSPHS
jgi:hypothetical protein